MPTNIADHWLKLSTAVASAVGAFLVARGMPAEQVTPLVTAITIIGATLIAAISHTQGKNIDAAAPAASPAQVNVGSEVTNAPSAPVVAPVPVAPVAEKPAAPAPVASPAVVPADKPAEVVKPKAPAAKPLAEQLVDRMEQLGGVINQTGGVLQTLADRVAALSPAIPPTPAGQWAETHVAPAPVSPAVAPVEVVAPTPAQP